MALFAEPIAISIIFMQLCHYVSMGHKTRTLLDETTSSPIYTMDCCERTSGLFHASIDCYDDNTPVILDEVQNYLLDPTKLCTNATMCAYSDSSSVSETETKKCLIAWALLQQYYHQCPQLVATTTNQKKTANGLPDISTEVVGSESIDYNAAPKMINPYIYRIMYNTPECDECYGESIEDGMNCNGLCDLSNTDSTTCGVCAVVTCNAFSPLEEALYDADALAIWQRALLLASVTILGCICFWGLCYLSCTGSNGWYERFRNNNGNMLQIVVNGDNE